MNYLEIAAAYDAQADVLMGLITADAATLEENIGHLRNGPIVEQVLALRERAEDNRSQYRREQAAKRNEEFEIVMRTRWTEAIEAGTRAQERKVDALNRQAAALEKQAEMNARLTEATANLAKQQAAAYASIAEANRTVKG